MDNSTVCIPLTREQIAIIDVVDAELALLKWHAIKNSSGGFYAVRTTRTHKSNGKQFLHRVILERVLGRPLAKSEQVDHINGDKLDNHRANLRLATCAENSRNRKKGGNNTSGYKGVTWDRRAGKWRASIQVDGKQIWLGLFATIETAYTVYCEAARELHGEFARFD